MSEAKQPPEAERSAMHEQRCHNCGGSLIPGYTLGIAMCSVCMVTTYNYRGSPKDPEHHGR